MVTGQRHKSLAFFVESSKGALLAHVESFRTEEALIRGVVANGDDVNFLVVKVIFHGENHPKQPFGF